jgi:hypothetical protein
MPQLRQSAENSEAPSNLGDRPTVPAVLIHLHIPKTAGTSLNSMVQHCFRSDEVFDSTIDGNELYNGLGLATYEYCRRRLDAYAPDDLQRIRYATGHVPMGLHRALGRSAKYYTVIRHPVDRVISDFFFRIQVNVPYLKDGRLLTFEEYVEGRCDIYLNDYQVRVVSGCPELDAVPGGHGEQTVGAPVERRHLEAAKRNIEEHFLAAAPLEQMTELALVLRRVYGWPIRRLLTEYKARTRDRPHMGDIAPHLINIIKERNSHDLELYEWAGKRFAAQRQLFEPELSRDKYIFNTVTRALNVTGQILPRGARKRLAQLLFYA